MNKPYLNKKEVKKLLDSKLDTKVPQLLDAPSEPGLWVHYINSKPRNIVEIFILEKYLESPNHKYFGPIPDIRHVEDKNV